MGGTVLAAQLALRYGIASNAAGGTHHATPLRGAGYTIINDLAVTAHLLTQCDDDNDDGVFGGREKRRRVLVVDCDVHRGDGTAASMERFPAGSFFTLSLHCKDNYPRMQGVPSTWDVGIASGCRDEEYLEKLENALCVAWEEARPDFVLYDAGVDIYTEDKLGRLKISEEGIRRRDRMVLDWCVGEGVPVVAVIGGGYDEDVDALARRHAIVHEECGHVWRKYQMWEQCDNFTEQREIF